MKKILLPLLLLTGLISPSVKGESDYGAHLLNDQQWHMLTFPSAHNETDDNWHWSTLSIRQKTVNGDYEFKSDLESVMIEFYVLLTCDEGVDQISMGKTSNGGYEGGFYDSVFASQVAKGEIGKIDNEGGEDFE